MPWTGTKREDPLCQRREGRLLRTKENRVGGGKKRGEKGARPVPKGDSVSDPQTMRLPELRKENSLDRDVAIRC